MLTPKRILVNAGFGGYRMPIMAFHHGLPSPLYHLRYQSRDCCGVHVLVAAAYSGLFDLIGPRLAKWRGLAFLLYYRRSSSKLVRLLLVNKQFATDRYPPPPLLSRQKIYILLVIIGNTAAYLFINKPPEVCRSISVHF